MNNDGSRKAVENGKKFETTTDLGFRLEDKEYCDVIHQNEFYDYFGIVWNNFLAKKILPDEVVINHRNQTIYIIEKKYRSESRTSAHSDDEKLYACDARKQMFKKMLKNHGFGYKVEIIYLMSEGFHRPYYNDLFEYMKEHDVKYYFNDIPVRDLGIYD